MPSDLHVRLAVPSDAPALTRLINPIIKAGGTTAIEEILSDADLSDYFIAGSEVLFCHLVEAEGEVVGFQALCRDSDLPATWGDIATFARLEHKIPGVGTALFSRTIQAARDQRLTALNAQIRADNVPGLAYYTKMGFVTYRTLEAVPLRDGRPVDRILKRYDLT
ncbi:GNAT family N-acetyltransferase [Lacibacterium aquatile]|uniref:GNAT family N-acetyltransferase n=1 Tax=Lacibacterium aquatile TaxID=1168082 RepID=A0ABW5DW31_9PROT